MKIYLAHPISGQTTDEVLGYYDGIVQKLTEIGFECLNPMTAKGYFRNDPKYKGEPLKSHGFVNPVSTNHAIVERDKWMVTQSDVVLVDYTGARGISIGCCMELAWASLLGKHTIVVLDADDLHKHAFVLDCADIVFPSLDEAVEYFIKLIKGNTA